MSRKEAEDRFVERFKVRNPNLTWESELLLRYGYGIGHNEAAETFYQNGREDQQNETLDALGATARKVRAYGP